MATIKNPGFPAVPDNRVTTDAPADGNEYIRKDGAWAVATGGGGGDPDWDDITNKPSTFPPEAHTHAVADVTGLQTSLDNKAAVSHTHAISAITNLQTTLDGKQALITSNVQTLGADVNMPSSATWYNAVSYTPAAGTWLFFGQIAFRRAATTARQYSTRIYDGTSAITGADIYVPSVNPSRAPLFCVGIATTDGTKTYTLQGQTTVGNANEFIRKDLSPGGDVATQLVSIKIG